MKLPYFKFNRKLLVLMLLVATIGTSCANSVNESIKDDRTKLMWLDATANIQRFNNKDTIDYYLTKPFSPRELVARVKSNIRRYKSLSQTKASHTNEQATYKYGDLEINTNSRSVLCANKNVELTKTEFDILLLLASKPNQVFTFEQIYTQVWDEEYLGNSNTVMVHIKRLRNKLGDNTKNPSYIKTIWGVGYKFIE